MCIDIDAENGCNGLRGFGIAWQRGISLFELIMFIVIIGVAETGMHIDPQPISLSRMLQ